MVELKPTIGLEIHAELKTRTKMFCDSLNDPDEKHPNANVCPVCLAHPGTLPVINKKAVESVIKVGLALGGKINPKTKFDRKNYFYPDIPKGYQISQYDLPLVVGGMLNGKRITRIHLEEDTGTLVHTTQSVPAQGGPSSGSGQPASLVDFNRAGVPLMELVTEPDFTGAEDTVAFARELQLILRYLGVSDADMEKGQMRIEANISLNMGTKVEVKNINSFKAVFGAIRYEIARQADALAKGEKLVQETRGWDDVKQRTVSQRSKEGAQDYRYFPEPDLPSFETDIFGIEKLRESLPELPREKRVRFEREYGLAAAQVEMLVGELKLAAYFEEMSSEILELCNIPTPHLPTKTIGDYKTFRANVIGRGYHYLVNNLESLINSSGLSREDAYEKVSPEHLAHLAFLVEFGLPELRENDKEGIAKTTEFLNLMVKTGLDAEELLRGFTSQQSKEIIAKIYELYGSKTKLKIISNKMGFGKKLESGEFEEIVEKILGAHPSVVEDYKKGKTASIQFLIGKSMAELKGRGNPAKLKELIEKILKK